MFSLQIEVILRFILALLLLCAALSLSWLIVWKLILQNTSFVREMLNVNKKRGSKTKLILTRGQYASDKTTKYIITNRIKIN